MEPTKATPPTDVIDRAVLQAVVVLDHAGLQAIAEAASEIAGQEIHHRRFVEPNVRTALDRLDAAGLVRDEGFVAGKAATVATDAGRLRAGGSP
ncbi:MAG: hypothetical protein ACT6RU_14605 [Aliihoeflea sp.]|uniref:hypothetical protein n=1 Tax=Aliihoeflea sp. TaxID=2608088 RepID=UPI004033F7DE